MVKSTQVLGIDFGTTNSYFCKYFSHPDEGHKVRPIDFGQGHIGSVPTTILYREDRSAIIGSTAEDEWGEASENERTSYSLRTHFKPDISNDEQSRQDSTNFLKIVASQMEAKRVDFNPSSHLVLFGIPGDADEAYKGALTEITTQAGYGLVQFKYEPIGALLYHLWNRDISPIETQRGVLVIDFGGGTCDFAFLQRLEVCEAWGDMMLGGRLFDDLFFKWYLEQNPGVLEKLVAEGSEYFVHWLECRRLKEFFSQTMKINRKEIVRKVIGQYGKVQDLTWDAFMERAKSYTAHPTFIEYLNSRHQSRRSRIKKDQQIDLIGWFRDCMSSGMEKHKIRSSDIERVILTGGSSQWPFVEDIVYEILHLDRKQILMSENPKAAIAEGLVILPSLQIKFDKASTKLKSGKGDFFEYRIVPEILQRNSEILDSIQKEISHRLYDGKIIPILYEFRENGGSISSLKKKLEVAIAGIESSLKNIIEENLKILVEALPLALHDLISDWFRENGLTYYSPIVTPQGRTNYLTESVFDARPEGITKLDEELVNIVGGSVIAISAAIVGTVAGGGGTALVMGGPVGFVIGAIVAAAFGYLALQYGKDRAREMVEEMNLPAWMVKFVLTEGKIQSIIEEGRKKFNKVLSTELENAVREPFDDMKIKIRRNIESEIEGLSIINQL